ncbi:MAG: T9SS type A sorting domain-containing protein, partial [Bacteroidota bacterium]
VALSDGCFDLSDNFIVVVREDVNGGMVQSELGADTLTVCYNDPTASTVFSFDSTGTAGPNFTYVVTDDQANILGVPPADMVNFAGAGPGICYVWGLSYSGNLTAMVGQNAASVALSDGCFDLSDNFIVVVREEVNGGMVQSELGPDTLSVCYNDPTAPTVFKFDSTGASGGNFTYVVTDDQANILGVPPADMVNFAGAGPGICYVWGLSYTGNLTAMVGQNAASVALSDGCFDLSDNFIVVVREDVNGGMVQSELGADTLNICYSDPNGVTTFKFDSTGTSGPNFTYVVTDDQANILGVPPADMVNFTGAGPGICYVWGLSYSGNLTAMVGQNAASVALSDGCFDLSDNFVVVVREEIEAGIVKSETNGPDDLYVCYNDPSAPTAFKFDSLGHTSGNFAYVVTDTSGTILGLPPGDMVDFAGAGPGICYVWGLAYTGNITAMAGDNALQTALADGCFDLSDNFIRVIRDSVDAGIVKSEINGPDDLLVCYNDANSTTAFKFDSLGHYGGNYAYVVTDTAGTILGLPPGDMVDFAGAGPGICYVWGLAYTGNITAMAGDNALQIALSDGCFDLSDNFITVVREDVNGGMVQAEAGSDTLLVCYAGGTTAYAFDSTGTTGSNFTYVVTDDNGVILGVPPADMVDFAGAGPGICYVWGLSYTGNLTAMLGDTATNVALSDGCFDLSDNFIVVLRDSTGVPCGMNLQALTQTLVYPVPAQNEIKVEIPGAKLQDDNVLIEIFGMSGQLKYSSKEQAASQQDYRTNIDISSFEKGVFILRVRHGDESIRRKFIKQ